MNRNDPRKTTEKQTLRTRLRALRRGISPEEQERKARDLLEIVENLPEFQNSHTIAAYWPFEGEINPLPILQKAEGLGKQCYLPVLPALKTDPLIFTEYKPLVPLIHNRFGILEPYLNSNGDIKSTLSPESLDLVLTPLVAFDEKGRRLGMGAGYYDRTFSFLTKHDRLDRQRTQKKPILIGLAYELQKIDDLPSETWDIPLQGIATEKRYIRIANKEKP